MSERHICTGAPFGSHHCPGCPVGQRAAFWNRRLPMGDSGRANLQEAFLLALFLALALVPLAWVVLR
jgi:hypothetical protein